MNETALVCRRYLYPIAECQLITNKILMSGHQNAGLPCPAPVMFRTLPHIYLPVVYQYFDEAFHFGVKSIQWIVVFCQVHCCCTCMYIYLRSDKWCWQHPPCQIIYNLGQFSFNYDLSHLPFQDATHLINNCAYFQDEDLAVYIRLQNQCTPHFADALLWKTRK